jgi:hypothetical protein
MVKTMKRSLEKRSSWKDGFFTLSNSNLEAIEERYANRIPNAETSAALSERPVRRFKTASQVLRSLKTSSTR